MSEPKTFGQQLKVQWREGRRKANAVPWSRQAVMGVILSVSFVGLGVAFWGTGKLGHIISWLAVIIFAVITNANWDSYSEKTKNWRRAWAGLFLFVMGAQAWQKAWEDLSPTLEQEAAFTHVAGPKASICEVDEMVPSENDMRGRLMYRALDHIRCFDVEEGTKLVHLGNVSAGWSWPWSKEISISKGSCCLMICVPLGESLSIKLRYGLKTLYERHLMAGQNNTFSNCCTASKLDAAARSQQIIATTTAMERFWRQAQGWAPSDAACMLAAARLDRQVSFAHTLPSYLELFSVQEAEARLILGYVTLRSLCEGILKLFFAVWLQDYQVDADAVKDKKGVIKQPADISFERLIALYSKKGESKSTSHTFDVFRSAATPFIILLTKTLALKMS